MSSPADIQRGLQAYTQAQALHRERRYAPAAAAYQRALALMPNHPQVIAAYAQLAEDVQDWAAAETLFRRLGALRPDVDYQGHLGVALFRQQKHAPAIPFLEAHLVRHPGEADVIHALSNALCALGRWEEGLARAREAMALKPDDEKTDAVLNALYHLGRVDELDALLATAMEKFPGSRVIRSLYAMHRLKSGDWREGFRYFGDFRWRNNLEVPANAGVPGESWDGRPFDGTLLVVAEQGLGDEIMMSSMLPDLVAMGQRALVECDERLLPLFARSFPAIGFVPRHRRQLQQAYAAGGVFRTVNALDLGTFFRRETAFPSRPRWLQPDPERVAALRADYRARWPGRRLVGLSWRSSRVLEGNAGKSIALAEFAPLLARGDCLLLSLQYGPRAELRAEIDAVRSAGHGELVVDERIDATDDIDGLAAQIAALDAVVSTSNSTAHIAGALGVPCLVLLPRTHPVLWYWGYAGERTPWYPSLRLLRNEREDDCSELLARAGTQLDALLAAAGAAP